MLSDSSPNRAVTILAKPCHIFMQEYTNAFLCIGLAFLACSQAILATLSKNKDGSYDYNTTSISLVAETLKLVLSSGLLITEIMSMDTIDSSSMFSALPMPNYGIAYLFLGILYAIQNNAIYFVMLYMNPGTFQVLINLKLPLIALLLVLFQNKRYSKLQIIGLAFLTLGATMPRVTSLKSLREMPEMSGYFIAGAMICVSAFASVVNEILLKNHELGSLHWQNCQLYAWGCFFCLINTMWSHWGSMLSLFHGYNLFSILNVINLSSLGLVTSVLLKYSNNIVRSISGILSIYFSILVSYMFLQASFNIFDVVGAGVVGTGIAFYSRTIDFRFLKV